ncbi:MAG: hypothetical protein EBU75_12900, partial [Betaproteobacteria bacterium]|nr:hypothetical protein [Betaproteobacteria bacterium]
MSISNASDLTTAVLAEMQRAQDPRTRELLMLLVKHLHQYVTESQLTESEFQQALGLLARLGQATHASHNEVALAAGSLGVSALVCLINNGQGGQKPTTANLMGPFWRMHSPVTPQGGSIVRSPTPGIPVFAQVRVLDAQGQAVADAEVDVWQCSADGYYENQDPEQADMNLRGKFTTDAQGWVRFRSVKPIGYPIPVSGPVGGEAPSGPANLSVQDQWALAQLLAQAAHLADAGRWIDWAELFTDDCLYLLQPRENFDRGFPLATMRLESKGMLLDRAYAVTQTIFHDPYYQRHVVGTPLVLKAEDGRPS